MKLFICYAHDDAADLKPLDDCLAPMAAEGLISYWTDRQIDVGANWSDAIKSALVGCDAGVFLLSMRFLQARSSRGRRSLPEGHRS